MRPWATTPVKLAAGVAACILRPSSHPRLPPSPTRPSERQLRKNWAALIRRVYEVDPLVSGVRRDDADRRGHHRAERDHDDPRAPRKGGRSKRDGGSGPRPVPPPARRAGARSLRQLSPRQQAGASTGPGEACANRCILQHVFANGTFAASFRRPRLAKPRVLSSRIAPESSARMEIGETNSRPRIPWTRARNAFSYP